MLAMLAMILQDTGGGNGARSTQKVRALPCELSTRNEIAKYREEEEVRGLRLLVL